MPRQISSSSSPQSARDYAIAAHGFQGYGGRPYVFHLDQVAARVRHRGPVYEIVAYLHDVLEDTGVTRDDLAERFGEDVARSVCIISDPAHRSRAERKAEINRQLAAVDEDSIEWPGLVVKVSDRLSNITMCVVDERLDLLRRYRREHPDFRAAAWRPEFRESFDKMERILSRPQYAEPELTPVASAEPVQSLPETEVSRRFVTEFAKNWESYRNLAARMGERCEALIVGRGIQGIVSYRAKTPERLRLKLARREAELGRPYHSRAELMHDIADLVGVRIALYFPDEASVLEPLLRRALDVLEVRLHRGSPSVAGEVEARFSGYWATHFRVAEPMPAPTAEAHAQVQTKDVDIVRVEVQVASVLMQAWAQVAHDLSYKPITGELSATEYALLDQLNGLMLAGETALDQLHKAMRARVRRMDRNFADHFELGSWLTRWTRLEGREQASLGRLDRLFVLLRILERARASDLELLLEGLGTQRPLADQIVERLLVEHPERVRQWQIALGRAGLTNPFEREDDAAGGSLDALTELSVAWAHLEAAAARYLTGKEAKSFPIGKKRLAALPFDKSQRDALKLARRAYLALARGGHELSTEQIASAAKSAQALAEVLDQHPAGATS